MASYLEQRYQTWYATLTVPADLRIHIGKRRFFESLKTTSKKIATERALAVIADWKAQLNAAKCTADPKQALINEAIQWRRDISALDENEDMQATIKGLLGDRATALEAAYGSTHAHAFYGVATGRRTPSNIHFESWKEQLDLALRTKVQMARDVSLLVEHFQCIEDITKSAVKAWTNTLTAQGRSIKTQHRILSFCRNYWHYLKQHDVVPQESSPLTGVLDNRRAKTTDELRRPFTAPEVVDLWSKALHEQDKQLADLIQLAAYTGARIEELCSLRISEVTEQAIEIKGSKTRAGNRIIPIHLDILPLVSRLKSASTDGYLISGLTPNKYNGRSSAIGKRFGRLKTKMQYSHTHVFHSIRKTFATQLENIKVGENIAADILGHEKPRITYGLYSGGTNLEVKAQVLAKVKYPFPA